MELQSLLSIMGFFLLDQDNINILELKKTKLILIYALLKEIIDEG